MILLKKRIESSEYEKELSQIHGLTPFFHSVIFYSFFEWHAPFIPHAPQEPPQEQELLPFFLLRIPTTITAKISATTITETMIVGIITTSQ